MIQTIKEIVECQEKLRELRTKLDDPKYWINKAKAETDFEPAEGDWVSVKIQSWGIDVYVYHKSSCEGARYWLNGKWFNTPFPKNYPFKIDIEALQ